MEIKTCVDAKVMFPADCPTCCISCHEDNIEYGYDLCGGYGILEYWEVCCTVAKFLEDKLSSQ